MASVALQEKAFSEDSAHVAEVGPGRGTCQRWVRVDRYCGACCFGAYEGSSPLGFGEEELLVGCEAVDVGFGAFTFA